MARTHKAILRRALLVFCCSALLTSVLSMYAGTAARKKNVLVISVTKGFKHSAIPTGEQIMKDLGEKSGLWDVDYARTDEELAQKTTAEALKGYDALVFNNTTGDLPLADRDAFLNWVKSGGNVYGIHAATDTFHTWPEFLDMMGGQFKTHGSQMEVDFLVQDARHPSTKDLPRSFRYKEEIYQLKNYSRSKIRVLVALDKHPNTFEPGDFPISWVRMYGKGRVFYTSIGHREDLMQTDYAQKHYLGGMKWVLGLAKGDAAPLPPPAPVTKSEKRDGFRPILNAKDLTGWHARHEGGTPWSVENGMLVMGNGGSDIITDEKFGDFVLRYEYMVPSGGNSGVYLRGRYEIQIMDDTGKTQPDVHSNGSIYGLIAPSKLVSRAPGEWQTVEAKLIGNKVTVTLNGTRIIDNQPLDSVTGAALDDKVNEPGPIMLQGDHGPIAYRNIRIKVLK